MKILHIIPHDGVGGVEVAARSMAEHGDLPCDFTLLLVAGETLARDRRRIIGSPFRATLNPLAQLRAVRTILRVRPDVLLCSLWRSVPAALVARLLLPGARFVYFLNLERPVHLVDALAARLAIAAADEVWADSPATLARRLRSRTKGRVISFVTDRLTAANPTKAAIQPRFVSWSRLQRQKGIDRALRFTALLVRRGVDATFDIWGPDDGEQASLESLAAELGLGSRVRFRGPASRSDLPAIAADNRFFLQLSRMEGMAMGTVEAMQLGLVPVTTAVGEMARYVVNGDTGVIVEPLQMDEGADAVMRILSSPEEYAKLRARAISTWSDAAIYAEDVCRAANNLAGRKRH